MGTFASDLRYALRALAKSPGFTLVAILTLALGIGANTAIFSVIDQVLLRPLPFKNSERMMRLQREYPNGNGDSVSIPKFMAWRQAPAFQSVAMYDFAGLPLGLGAGDRPDQVSALHVSAAFFDVFGVTPSMGRTFTPQEDLPSAGKFVVLTHQAWQNHLGGDPNIAGKPILLGREQYVVLGILPPDYQPDPPTDLYLPLQADPNSNNQGHIYPVAGRLRDGATIAEAKAQLRVIGEQFRARFPDTMNKNETVGVLPLRDAIGGDVKLPLMILGGAVSFVLLIACANVASLLLVRGTGRRRELAIRAAVGASRGRIVRQLLTESLMLAMAGGVAGFLAGAGGVRALLAASPGDIPRINAEFGAAATLTLLDTRVLLFTLGVSLITGILFGLLPAVSVSRLDVNSSLKESSGRSGTGLKQNRVRGALVVGEVALALVLLVGAALMIRTFAGLHVAKPGMDPTQLLTFKTGLNSGRYNTTAQADLLERAVLERLESVPGVQSAARAFMLPFEQGIDMPFTIEGRAPANGKWEGDEFYRPVSGRYFESFRIPLRRGRLFDQRDTAKAPHVIIINESFARTYWKTGDPLGQRIRVAPGLGADFEEGPREIVGIVGNVREDGFASGEVGVYYVPTAQLPDGITKLANGLIPAAWIVRTKNDPLAAAAALQTQLLAIDPQLSMVKIRTMEKVMADSTSRQNFNMLLLTVFASAALLLASIGIYGLLAYSVQQRTQEIGIRMALGANRGTMMGLVLRQGLLLVGIGIVLGLAAAYGLTRLLAGLLYGVKASDPATFAAVAALLAGVALVAALVPARRATRIDPVIAMRAE